MTRVLGHTLTPGALVALVENQAAAITRVVERMLDMPEGHELDEYQLESAQDAMGALIEAFEELRRLGFIDLEDAADHTPRVFLDEEGTW